MCIHRKKRTRLSVLAVLLSVLMMFPGTAYGLSEWPSECYVLSEGACLMDGSSGVVLYQQNANEAYYPASITKVLTALVVIENCENLSETVTFSYDAVHIEEQNSTIIGASEGDRLSVLDCLYCLLFQSANEVANALAEHVGAKHPELKEKGETDLQVFVKMMNQRAVEAGGLGSHFNNPSGLTDENHYTTPYDMCMIMKAAIGNETFRNIESHTYWTHAPIMRYPDADDPWNTVYMKHMMLRKNSDQYYEGCIAGKTGYTVTAGNTLVTACERNGMTLLCCVMNAHANHYNDTTRLFDFGFENFSSLRLSEHDRTESLIQNDYKIGGVPVLDSFTIGLSEDAAVTIPKEGDFSEVTSRLTDSGEMVYYYGDHEAGRASLVKKTLGGLSELFNAEDDPVFYQIAGIEPPEKETETEETGETKETGIPETEETESEAGTEAEKETAAVTPREKTDRKKSAKKVLIICAAAGTVLGAGFIVKYELEKAEARRRRKRRLERMKKTEDLTGTQRIRMDLEVQRRSRKNGSKKRR